MLRNDDGCLVKDSEIAMHERQDDEQRARCKGKTRVDRSYLRDQKLRTLVCCVAEGCLSCSARLLFEAEDEPANLEELQLLHGQGPERFVNFQSRRCYDKIDERLRRNTEFEQNAHLDKR